ncbi:MAG: CopD family protein [Gammaproteobacteria bacterium]|nr:CopD family protein [Gammaproteobacteria bacterium]
MLWPKALHLIFMVAWFAGLFYLPRLFINHAMTENHETSELFKVMERKLYRFTTPWMVLTLVFGTWMLIDYAWAAYGSMLWLQIKLALIRMLVIFHFYCGKLVKIFAQDLNQRSHKWYRYFNEIPAVIMFIMIPLAVLKPF